MRRRRQPAQASRNEPPDPLLARLTRIEAQARGIEGGKTLSPTERRRETLSALADLGLVLQALRSAEDGMRAAIDGTLVARRVTQAYRQAGALSRDRDRPFG